MPHLSDSMEEGTIIRWLKAAGDEVKRGEELVEIGTDKATIICEADFSGVLTIIVAEGAGVPVGTAIAEISNSSGPSPAGVPPTAPATTPPPAAVRAGPSKTVTASPLARRLAHSLGVDLSAVAGSGPHGRIVRADVAAASASRETAAAEVSARAPGRPSSHPEMPAVNGEDRVQELTQTQVVIARRMALSRSTVPEFTLQVDVDMSATLRMRREFIDVGDSAPSLNDIIVKACAVALRRHPRANGSFQEDHFVLRPRVNVAIAVAAQDALIAPVVRDADEKTLGRIAQETRRLIERVRSSAITPGELDGGTFTVSNLGMFGIERFEGIINAPQSGILCVVAVRDQPVAIEGQVVIRPIVSMTLACDHRILYGADAAMFLGEVRRLLENPLAMFL
jgi:pyruvate dehydrogenase E2 component (dihydrolipoamide acetyltransferase)